MRNSANIETAMAALARAAWTRGQSPTYDEEAVCDLLADLKHFCVAPTSTSPLATASLR